ncbi:hypothetical protein D3C79_1048180 [compost metagenome]
MPIEDQRIEQRGLARLDPTHDADLQQAIFLGQMVEGLLQGFGTIDGVLLQPLGDVLF